MAEPKILFDHVWKKFQRGQRHNTLRDLIPSTAKALFRRRDPQQLQNREEFWAVKDVSFEVHAGQALGIIGPNGAGKSTTLKLLTRLLKPTRGRCQVRGRVGALIELAAGFHPDLTGRENVFMQGAIMGMKRAEIRERFDEIVEFGGLGEFIDTPVKRYSNGMNARLGFAVAAHLNPDVLLIDEVLAVGDFSFQQKCYQRLLEFREGGSAIAFVSHNLQAIASLCDTALLLRPHADAFIGSIGDVTAAYAATGSGAASPRAEVLRAQLSRESVAGPLHTSVAPGTRLTLDVSLRVQESLPRCGFGVRIQRSDGLVVFDGISSLDGVPTLDLQRQSVMQSRVNFYAHLLRGTYFVAAYLIDSLREWPLLPLGMVASFVVVETTRLGGCAELEPTYDLSIAADSTPEPKEAAVL